MSACNVVRLETRLIEFGCYFFTMAGQSSTNDRRQNVSVTPPPADMESFNEDSADLALAAERRNEERITLAELKKQLTDDGLLPG